MKDTQKKMRLVEKPSHDERYHEILVRAYI